MLALSKVRTMSLSLRETVVERLSASKSSMQEKLVVPTSYRDLQEEDKQHGNDAPPPPRRLQRMKTAISAVVIGFGRAWRWAWVKSVPVVVEADIVATVQPSAVDEPAPQGVDIEGAQQEAAPEGVPVDVPDDSETKPGSAESLNHKRLASI